MATGSGVDDEARGLVDGDDVLVFIEDVEGDVLGEGVERLQFRGFEFDGLSGAELIGCLLRHAVDACAVFVDPRLNTRAAELRQAIAQEVVEPGAGRRFVHKKLLHNLQGTLWP